MNKAKLIENVAQLVREKKIEGISDIRDESDREGMRIVFDLKKGENSQVVLNQLYKNTQMETSYGVSMLALDHQQPKLMNIKELLNAFLNHRKEVVTRRTVYELKKAEEKAHILDALKRAVENLDEVVALIRRAPSPVEAQSGLQEKYSFSERQAKAILEMRLQRLTGLEREKIAEDYKNTIKQIEEYKSILADDNRVIQIIIRELDEVRAEFGDKRRTQFIEKGVELTEEDYISEEMMAVTVTVWLHQAAARRHLSLKRRGKGIIGAGTLEEDFV